ncbi:hypothetical protein BIWAKO_01834 [Bosea sp. BIWAKO-01]|nr:hypothetical protein BIWAKO_01834 [Bosea sp. BIWAKO-01]
MDDSSDICHGRSPLSRTAGSPREARGSRLRRARPALQGAVVVVLQATMLRCRTMRWACGIAWPGSPWRPVVREERCEQQQAVDLGLSATGGPS